jgi:hypothetical protein
MTVIEFPAPTRHSTIGRFRFNPLGYVMYAFPWGQPGTALAGESGPEPWQRDVLEKLGDGLDQRDRTPDEAVRLAIASGHGIGKSALVAWIVLWALSTLPDTRGVVTANTEGQLRTKDLARTRQMARACGQQGLVHLHRDLAVPFRGARARPHLARRCHHLVGEQHRGHCRLAQQGSTRLCAVR